MYYCSSSSISVHCEIFCKSLGVVSVALILIQFPLRSTAHTILWPGTHLQGTFILALDGINGWKNWVPAENHLLRLIQGEDHSIVVASAVPVPFSDQISFLEPPRKLLVVGCAPTSNSSSSKWNIKSQHSRYVFIGFCYWSICPSPAYISSLPLSTCRVWKAKVWQLLFWLYVII